MSEHIYRHQTFPDQVDWHEQVIESWDEEPTAHLAFPLHVGEALLEIAEMFPVFIDEAADMAGWADVTPGATSAYRQFMALVRDAQKLATRLDDARDQYDALRDAAAAARDASGGRA